MGAKGIAASVAKLRHALIAKAVTRGQAASTEAFSHNRLNSNTLTTTSSDAATISSSAGGYVVRQQDNTDDFLTTNPELDPFVLGRKT